MISRILFELSYLFTSPRWDTGISPPELLAYLEERPPGRAIDLGCGTGTNVITLARKGWSVTGVDSSRFAIRRAEQKAIAADIEANLLHEDVSRLRGVNGPFDLLLDIGCLHSLPKHKKLSYVRAITSVAAPGATYLLYSWLRGPDDNRDLPDEVEIEELFQDEFLCTQVQRGTDGARTSAWFTFTRQRR